MLPQITSSVKALGICDSPRVHGNTETMLNIILDELSTLSVYTEAVNVCRINLKPCTSCRTCVKTGKCRIYYKIK